MKRINVFSISLLAVMISSFTVELQGMTVKAIDDANKLVLGFLPYYRDSNGEIQVIFGVYDDAKTAGKLLSAPVELSGAAFDEKNLNSMVAQYIPNVLQINARQRFQFRTDKTYYLWTVEIAEADGKNFLPGHSEGPTGINTNPARAYISGWFTGPKITEQPLFIDYKFSNRNDLMARGFGDLFKNMTTNATSIRNAFPVSTLSAESEAVKKSLAALEDSLRNLSTELYVSIYQSQP